MKKLKIMLLSSLMTLCAATGAYAANTDMYVNGNYVVRDLRTVGEFDMLPILDIAGELGYQCSFDGTKATLYNKNNFYIFAVGNALVTDKNGNLYGLDIVPQYINNNLYIPAKFLQDLGMTYTWDDITSTLFINSDYTYQWLINTPEYQYGKLFKKTQQNIQGWWYNRSPDSWDEEAYFGDDGTYYYQSGRLKCYGTYTVVAPNVVKVYYDEYGFGQADESNSGDYAYTGSYTGTYEVVGFHIKGGQFSDYFSRA